MKQYKILVINPGSTSTKVAVYINGISVFSKNIDHSLADLAPFQSIPDQYEYRKDAILETLKLEGIVIDDIDVVMGRGGLVKSIESGVYAVCDELREDLIVGIQGQHACNLGGLIARDIAESLPAAKAYIADPVVVDELQDVARLSGLPEMPRKSIYHALNQKSVARRYAESINKSYRQLNLIVAHIGGGITIGAHCKGRVIDVNNGLDGIGPFSPERAGTLPSGDLVNMCFSGIYSKEQIKKKIVGNGGLMAHRGTNRVQDVRKMANEGDGHAKLVLDAMAYQIGKTIGSAAAVLHGKADAIILTGGVAFDQKLVEYIRSMVSFIAPIIVIPGEDEMKSLAENALNILTGKDTVKNYSLKKQP